MMRTLLLTVALVALAGCNTYKLIGQVVSGPRSMVQIVSADDPRLAGPPVANASIEVTIDPNKGNRQVLPVAFADEQGNFEIPVDVLGAGMLEYDMLVIGRLPKKSPAEGLMRMPGKSKRVLVILADGKDHSVGSGDPFNEARDQVEKYYPQ